MEMAIFIVAQSLSKEGYAAKFYMISWFECFKYVFKFLLLCSFSTEIEAIEACNWLRAAGFPQYAAAFSNEDDGECFKFFLGFVASLLNSFVCKSMKMMVT